MKAIVCSTLNREISEVVWKITGSILLQITAYQPADTETVVVWWLRAEGKISWEGVHGHDRACFSHAALIVIEINICRFEDFFFT